MGKLILEANVRLKGCINDVTREKYDAVVAEYKNEKELEKRAKEDFIRAIEEDLGFNKNEINVTKFTYRLIEDSE